MQVPGYEPVRFYDAPGLVLRQMTEGQGTIEGVFKTFFQPQQLSLSERMTFAQELAAKHGSNSISRTMTGILTNPLVWLMFISSPVASPVTAAVGRGLSAFSVKKEYSRFVQGNRNMLGMLLDKLGFTNSFSLMEGTPGTAVAMQISKSQQAMRNVQAELIETPLQKLRERLAAKHGVKPEYFQSFVPEHYAAGPIREDLREIQAAMRIRTLGLDSEGLTKVVPQTTKRFFWKDRDTGVVEEFFGFGDDFKNAEAAQARYELERQRYYKAVETNSLDSAPEEVKRWKNGEFFTKTETLPPKTVKQEGIFDKAAVDEAYARWGLQEVEDATQKAQRFTLWKMVGDERLSYWEPLQLDRQKVWKAYSTMVEKGSANDVPMFLARGKGGTYEGKEVIASLFDAHTLSSLKTGELSFENFEEMLKASMPDVSRKYSPLNLVKAAKADGVELGEDVLRVMQDKPYMLGGEGRVVPLTSDRVLWDPDELEWAATRFKGDKEVMRQVQRTRIEALEAAMENKRVAVHSMNHLSAVEKYLNEGATHFALHGDELTDAVMDLQAATLKHVDPDQARLRFMPKSLSSGGRASYEKAWKDLAPEEVPGFGGDPRKAISPAMALQYVHDLVPDPWVKGQIREVVVDAMLNRSTLRDRVAKSNYLFAKQAAGAFINSSLGKSLASSGGWSRELMMKLQDMADPDTPSFSGTSVSGSVARYLYVTHLGLNLGSIVQNLTQPLLLAGTSLGFGGVAKAYAQSIEEMGTYFSKRLSKYGMRSITELERAQLIEESFKFAGKETKGANLLGIGPDTFANVDAVLMAEKATKSEGVGGRVLSLMMKGFEKSEWMNRNVAAHMLAETYKKGGRSLQSTQFLHDLERFVAETQFTAESLNTPRLFRENKLFGNPLIRQFLTFPVRSLTNAVDLLPRMGEQDYWTGLWKTMGRGLGMSAVIYEGGKQLAGVDLTGGLFASSTFGLLNVMDRRDQGPLPVPPVIDIPFSLVKGLAEEDREMVAGALARMVPGGIGVSRALSAAPELGNTALGLPGLLQKNYAGWSTPLQDGRIPIYKGNGNLVGFDYPANVLFKGLGLDMGRGQRTGELDGYLVKQREEITRYQTEYMRRASIGDIPGAQAVAAEFSRRFKDPLTKQPLKLMVSEQQMKLYLRNQQVPRGERILDRLPAEMRDSYAQAAEGGGFRGNAPLDAGSTASQRMGVRESAGFRSFEGFDPH